MNSPRPEPTEAAQYQHYPKWTPWAGAGLSILVLSIGIAWVSTSMAGIYGWTSFLVILLVGSGILFGSWWLLKKEGPPRWLGMLLIGALLLRIFAGVFWLYILPIWGHGTPAEKAGYVMADAGARDQAAWKLAQSGKPLWSAFQDNRKVDQYGGLLFMSALVYRYLGGNFHQPIMTVLIVAIFETLAVLFTWAFARLAWGEKEAKIAAWVIALYPESILLGSSQMREAFSMTFTMIAFYGLLRYRRDHSYTSLMWILAPLLLSLPFSPPFAALLLGMLIFMEVATRFTSPKNLFHQRSFWIVMGFLLVLVLTGLYVSLKQFTPEDIRNPIAMLGWWFRKSGQLQAYLSRHASGWLQKIFKTSPEWTHLPILIGYGVMQPFLPAAIVVGSQSPIWRMISIWRAVGWTFMLIFMIYGPILSMRKKDDQGFTKMLCLIVWVVILVASFRGGGDMWDNPRYRAAIAGLQAALVGWAWVEHRRANDPWLRLALISASAVFAWFLPWYLRRYTSFTWPVVDLFKTLGLGFATALLLGIWDWARVKQGNRCAKE
jgi:hypothetical protein